MIILIYLAIEHIAKYLNQFLKITFGHDDTEEKIVVISNVIEQDGTVVTDINNKVVLSLVNIEKETASGRMSLQNPKTSDQSIISYPPVHLNFYLLFSAHFTGSNYRESLKYLSNTISFFQRNPVFNHQNTPDLSKEINKLILEIENLSFSDLNNIWSNISGKYIPSILYKVRTLSFDAEDIKAQIPTLKELHTTVLS